MLSRRLAVTIAICGCAAHAAPADKPASKPPTPDRQLVDALTPVLRRGDQAEATAIIERARHAAVPPGAENLAYYDATVHAYQGDYRGATEILRAYATLVGPAAEAAFGFHDAMIALRTADGDVLGALVECEEMVRVGSLGTWSPADRMTTVRLKQHWHRAYLLRMIAQTRTGAERQAFIDYAETARHDYIALATPIEGTGDSIAVLNGYFAFCNGDQAAMRDAAHRVKVAEDNDVEDLYLVQLALDGAGEHDAATALRARIAALPFVTVLTPVFVDWMRRDATPEPGHGFSPAHPGAVR